MLYSLRLTGKCWEEDSQDGFIVVCGIDFPASRSLSPHPDVPLHGQVLFFIRVPRILISTKLNSLILPEIGYQTCSSPLLYISVVIMTFMLVCI